MWLALLVFNAGQSVCDELVWLGLLDKPFILYEKHSHLR